MTRNALLILLPALVTLGAADLCSALETPEPWRTDYRRPGGHFGRAGDAAAGMWRTDARRPDGVHDGTAASTVEWWRVDARRPAWFPRGTMMVSVVDSDGDGVMDDMDRCPDTPMGAVVDARGCPKDSDGDGVYDGVDRCPDTPMGAVVDALGCPKDSDGDGVPDGLDRCPDTPKGVKVDETGCTVVTSEKEAELLDTGTLRLENVYFDTNMATLKPESDAALNEAGEILAKWPQLRIEVAGHTDSMGEDAYNLDLSRRRAQAVLDYLLGHFSLKGDRFSVKGYGETMPVADNGTAAGRAENRRVELKVLNREVLKKQ
jgi:outer membrane protein OmpA-like peptidoglycan-associated protein